MQVSLNIPEMRLKVLRRRLLDGEPLVAARIAEEFDVSLDTVRRDLIALEASGEARRVRGGALRPAVPAEPMEARMLKTQPALPGIARKALALCQGRKTLLLDGGTTVLALAHVLEPERGLLVVTPSPWVAVACQTKGIEVLMLGGKLSAGGGISVGLDTEAQLHDLAADMAILGACGLDAAFGMSSDDALEAGVKRAMARAAAATVVLADRSKLGQRARHRTLPAAAIDHLVTDADPAEVEDLRAAGLEVHHA